LASKFLVMPWFWIISCPVLVVFSMTADLLFWNANSLPLKELELVTFLREFGSVVCGVSETRMDRLSEGFVDVARHGFHVLGFGNFRQGVLVYASPALSVVPLREYCVCNVDLCAVTVQLQQNVIVFAYCHDGNRVRGVERLLDLSDRLRERYGSVVLMGDLNARRTQSSFNAAGRKLDIWLGSGLWKSHADDVPTHASFHIDYCIDVASSPSVDSCSVLQDLSSDHAVLLARLRGQDEPRAERFISWRKFSVRYLPMVPQWNWSLSVDDNVFELLEFFAAAVKSCEILQPRRRDGSQKYVEFDEELRRIKRRRNRAQRGTAAWKLQNSLLRKSLRRKRSEHWTQSQEEAASDRSGSSLWRILRRIKSTDVPAGRIYAPQDVATEFLKFHVPDFVSSDATADIDGLIDSALNLPVQGVTGVDVRKVLGSLPKRSV
jgi:hypothetical protein